MIKAGKGLIKGAIKIKLLIAFIFSSAFLYVLLAGVLFLIILTVVGLASNDTSNEDGGMEIEEEMGGKELSPHVLKYKDKIEKYAKQYDVEKQVPFILAMMQQESGGNPSENDPMQSSESKCGTIGCITDKDESIKQGVKYFKSTLKEAKGDVLLAVASYNMGGGFISYFQKEKGDSDKLKLDKVINGKKTSEELVSFSQKEYKKNPSMYNCSRAEGEELDACHGDIMYVDSILEYVDGDEGGSDGSSDKDAKVKGDKAWVVPFTQNITSPFQSSRENPVDGEVKPHNGIDIAEGGISGEKVVSFSDGKVTHASMSGTAGNMVQIEHGKSLTTVYMHLSSMSVKEGQTVKAGEKIGEVGTTGNSTGPHLHFETRIKGNAVNPEKFVKDL